MFNKAGYEITKQEGINQIESWKFRIFNLFTLGTVNDTKYPQFVNVAIKIES